MFDDYHRWYYDTQVWMRTTFLGVPCQKSVSDMWTYQEILFDLKPSVIVEFGAYNGGSTLYFAKTSQLVRPGTFVLSVDIDLSRVDPRARQESAIRFLALSSADPRVADEIQMLRNSLPGPLFVMVDSDHRREHVLAELELLRGVTRPGDYLVVEDGNVNGHPVLPGWGDGPFEAIEEYAAKYPDDYQRDVVREAKFGWTFAPSGFLIRR